MTVDFHPEAEAEFHAAAHWYEDCSIGLGNRFSDAIRAGIKIISSRPKSFQPLEGNMRVFRLERFPYRIYFRHDPDREHVRIFAVMHEKREPDYWRKRTDED